MISSVSEQRHLGIREEVV